MFDFQYFPDRTFAIGAGIYIFILISGGGVYPLSPKSKNQEQRTGGNNNEYKT